MQCIAVQGAALCGAPGCSEGQCSEGQCSTPWGKAQHSVPQGAVQCSAVLPWVQLRDAAQHLSLYSAVQDSTSLPGVQCSTGLGCAALCSVQHRRRISLCGAVQRGAVQCSVACSEDALQRSAGQHICSPACSALCVVQCIAALRAAPGSVLLLGALHTTVLC